MTIEEKAKAYDRVSKEVKDFFEGRQKMYSDVSQTLDYLFPELKESKDEKIRKELIHLFQSDTPQQFGEFTNEQFIAWLEKQGEQKPVNDTDEDIVEAVKDTSILDMVEPKFKVGDWIVFNGFVLHIDEIVDGYYRTTSKGGITNSYDWDIDNAARLWTIQDAKDGDVLRLGCIIAMFKKYIGQEKCICYCSISENGDFEIPIENGEDNVYGCTNTTPATKEQCDLLFQKMKEDGYMWDAEKKELSPVKLKAGQVLKHDNLSILCLGGRNAIKYNGEPFVIQYPDEWIEVYGEEYDKFFTQLQSSGYYYDFLHNQVKENCSTLWVARDFDGALAVFTNKPVLTKSKNRWIDLTDKNDFFNVLPEYYYPKVTFENSPLQLFHL